MAFNLAELFVTITGNDKPLNSTLGRVHQVLTGVSGQLLALGGAAIGAAGIGVALKGGVERALDLEETLSKVGVVFGEQADLVTGKAQQLADDFGLAKGSMLDAASQFGLLGKAAGMSQKESAKLSAELTQLAADAMSFYNVPMDVALQRIQSGLVGETEPMRAFGVLLSAAAVENKALAMGLAKSKDGITEQAKVAARAQLIMEGMTDASGDLARTSGSTSNQLRLLKGSLSNTFTTIGTAVLPALNRVVSAMNERLAPALETVGFIVRNFGDIWEIASLMVQEKVANIVEWVMVIPANLGQVADYLSTNWLDLMRDGLNAFLTIFQNAVTNVQNLWSSLMEFLSSGTWSFDWTPLLEGFEATAAKLPEIIRPDLTSMESEIGAAMDRIANREAKRNEEKAAAAAKLAAGEEGDSTGGTAGKSKEAGKRVSLEEFARGLQESLFGDKTAEESLSVQREQLAVQKEQLAAAKKPPKPQPGFAV